MYTAQGVTAVVIAVTLVVISSNINGKVTSQSLSSTNLIPSLMLLSVLFQEAGLLSWSVAATCILFAKRHYKMTVSMLKTGERREMRFEDNDIWAVPFQWGWCALHTATSTDI